MDGEKLMKIAYISSTSSGMHNHSIYFDLLSELRDQGHDVTIVYAREARENKQTELYSYKNMRYLGVRTGNMTKNKNLIEKAYSTLTIDGKFISAIKKHIGNEHFDLVLFSTPPITFIKTVKYFNNSKSFVYLMLKDIFPQNAADIGLFRQNGVIYRFFRHKEIKIYKMSDFIGVMSPANLVYLNKFNPSTQNKSEVLPNAIRIGSSDASLTRDYFKLNEKDFILFYGGNLGLPQGIDFIIECMDALEFEKNVKLVICGDGSEASRIRNAITNKNLKNTIYLGQLASSDYNELTKLADAGLIFLDKRFTIPNFPQRMLSYMEASIPIIFATDTNTDIGTIATANNYGLNSKSDDVTQWISHVKTLMNDEHKRIQMGLSGNAYLKENYDVQKVCKTLLKHLEDKKHV